MKVIPKVSELTLFASTSMLTRKSTTSLTATSSFLYRIWNVLLIAVSSSTDAGNTRSQSVTETCNTELFLTETITKGMKTQKRQEHHAVAGIEMCRQKAIFCQTNIFICLEDCQLFEELHKIN